MVHGDTGMQPIQCFNLFSILVMVCGLLTIVSKNDMVAPIDRRSVHEAMEFLAECLAVVQSLMLGEEQSIVATLVDTIS